MFKDYINRHFDGCRLLAHARDEHRNRDVRVFALPGHFDVVGVTDGTDAWVAPVICDPFSVKVSQLLADLRAGVDVPVAGKPLGHRQRVRIQPDPPAPRPRIRICAQPETTPQSEEPRSRRRVQIINT